MNTKRIIILLIAMAPSLVTIAQLADPREKFSISAEVDGTPNSDYRWESDGGKLLETGRMRQDFNVRVRANVRLWGNERFALALSPFYNFSTINLKPDADSHQVNLSIPEANHHYGGSLSGTYSTQLFGKPFSVMAIATGNFSRYGYEYASFMAGGVFTITRNANTYLALGAIYLMGTAVKWPLYPMIIYTHRFDEHWSVNVFETNNYLYYQQSPKWRYAFGMELETDKIFLRPDREDLPRKVEIAELAERFGVFADYQATPELKFNAGLGVLVPFYSRLRESGSYTTFMRMYGHVRPFVKFQVKYTLPSKKKKQEE